MTKKLEETFNLPPMNATIDDIEEENSEVQLYNQDEMRDIIERADKIDAALPQISGLDHLDADYDKYADRAMEVFDDLVDLGKNVEDRFAADIFNAASSMMGNALNAKTNKAQKKLETVKLQVQKAKLEHEKEKLEYLKKRHLKTNEDIDPTESEGRILATRNDMMEEILKGIKGQSNG